MAKNFFLPTFTGKATGKIFNNKQLQKNKHVKIWQVKTALIALALAIVAIFAFFFYFRQDFLQEQITQIQAPKPKPWEKYSIENLTSTQFKPSEISIGKILKENTSYTSVMFYFYVDGKKVSGVMNIPKKDGVYPVIEMNRGYIDKEKYQPGTGTQHAAEVFAQNGFITLAPDFLGYGESDKGAESSMEDRFLTYTTAATLLASIDNLNQTLSAFPGKIADPKKVGLWGHSNGGQITLTLLEITQKPYPTVLWAPVSKPFPYSILYYTDEFDDHGKALRGVVAAFEKDYDAEKYSLTNYLSAINGPIQLHQGGLDEAVPLKWSNQLTEELKAQKKDITYFTYPSEDHNFTAGNWGQIVNKNIQFYLRHFKNTL